MPLRLVAASGVALALIAASVSVDAKRTSPEELDNSDSQRKAPTVAQRPHHFAPTTRRFGAGSLEGFQVSIGTTQGPVSYFSHGKVLIDVQSSAPEFEESASLHALSLVSAEARPFSFLHHFDGDTSARVVSSGPIQLWMDPQARSRGTEAAGAGSFAIPVVLRVSFSSHALVVSTSSLARPAASSSDASTGDSGGIRAGSQRAYTELRGTLHCATEGPDELNRVLVCDPLELAVAAAAGEPAATFVQSATVTFPGALPQIGTELLATVDALKICYRYHRVKVNAAWGECPSFSGAIAAWANCCIAMEPFPGADLVLPGSNTAAPQNWGWDYQRLFEDSMSEGLEPGCSEMVTLLCVPNVEGGASGAAFTTAGVVVAADELYNDIVLAHVFGHMLGVTHADSQCHNDADVAYSSVSNFNTPPEICALARMSSRATFARRVGSCVEHHTACS